MYGFVDDNSRLLLAGENHPNDTVWFYVLDKRENPLSFCEEGITVDNYARRFTRLEPDSSDLIFKQIGGRKWKYVFPEGIRVHVWREDVIEEIGWDVFLRDYSFDSPLYEVEYVLSLDYLDYLDTHDEAISYPPEGELEKMVIYP